MVHEAHNEGLEGSEGVFYKSHNLSNTSIDSETLLDHRDQHEYMRPRRPSIMTPNAQSNQGASRQRTTQTGKSDDEGDDREESHNGLWSEGAPLLSSSLHYPRAQTFAGYGSNDMMRKSRPESRPREGSRASSKRKFLNPFTTTGAGSSYNINYPPSMPGSPEMRPSDPLDMSFGDVMLRDQNGHGSPRRDEEPHGDDDEALSRPSPSDRRRTMALQAEEDVCFPRDVSEIADDEMPSRDASVRMRGRRRRAKWPELSIVEEWSRIEKEGRSEERRVKKITEPQLINGRLRTVHRGWYQAEEDAPYRFTYFNEELQKQMKAPKPTRFGDRPVWWLNIYGPTEAEMKVISKAFGIHPLTAEDIMMQEAREKVELFRHYYFVSYRSFDQDPSSANFLEPVNMYVVVFREGVISFHFSATPHPANVRRRIRQLSDYLILSSDWISYAIIDDITDVFGPLIQNIENEVDEIDDAILALHSPGDNDASATESKKRDSSKSESGETVAESGGDMLRRVGDCRKKVMSLYRLLGNKADVIKGFAKRCNEHWEVAPRSEIGLYLGDIQDHIVTMTSNLSHYEKILARSHANYLAQINIRMNERQEQTADVLGKLTVLGTIVLPMNIITGLWGMNVWVPGQEHESDLTWFVCISGGLLLFGAACYYLARRVYNIV
ncbi:hypothetical protein P8C59_007868 [Phyllachora maydis]|uniref:Uncharacterized protein n=1 Tax=Phyllachora maydis TaxID=1825666 RepID=A0AAD9IAK8_9PEZI|nr:hypothetical protein P8C59_007868 [Phyllachora maydis]